MVDFTGATTTWEEWNGNNSRNHPMFGGGFTWFYRKMAGLNSDQQEPGYKHIIIKPYPPKAINYASYSTRTPFGQAAVSWENKIIRSKWTLKYLLEAVPQSICRLFPERR